jgi:outer membrane protein
LARALALNDAVDIALCEDPQVRAAWAAIKVQAAGVGVARAAYLPTLNGSIAGQHSDTRYATISGYDSTVKGYSTYAALNWRMFDFGERKANRLAANYMLAAALASYDAQLQKTLASTVQAYFDAMTAQAACRAHAQEVRLARQTLETAQRREFRGAAGRSDTLQAATALAHARLTDQRASGDADKAMATLVYMLGLPAATRITLSDQSWKPAKQDVADLSQWVDAARVRHPAIIAERDRIDAAREKVTSVRSQGMPTVDFGVSLYRNGYPNQSVQAAHSNTAIVGVTMNLPLFDGFARTYKIREAQAEVNESDARMQDAEREILGAVVKAHADALSSLASLDTASMLVDAAQSALASSSNRYEHGVADIVEVLNAQSSLADAQLERIRSESDWRSARLRLMADAGLLGRQRIMDMEAPAPRNGLSASMKAE